MEALKPAPGGGAAQLLDAAPACARMPLLPISMPPIDTAAALSLHARRGGARGSAAHGAGAAGAAPDAAADVAAAIQARLAGLLQGGPAAQDRAGVSTDAARVHADLAGDFSFTGLVLAKPLSAAEGAGAAAGAAEQAEGEAASVASTAMATLESLGAKFSSSAVQEHLGSVFGHGPAVFSGGLFNFSMSGGQ